MHAKIIAVLGSASLGVLSLGTLAGCAPVPPHRINAVLGAGVSIRGTSPYDAPLKAGDTRVAARYRSSKVYAERRRGDWITGYHLVRFDVVRVERGGWSDPDVTFTCTSRWPTVESGIVLSVMPWPYKPGAEWVFELDTTEAPACIVNLLPPEEGSAADGGEFSAGEVSAADASGADASGAAEATTRVAGTAAEAVGPTTGGPGGGSEWPR